MPKSVFTNSPFKDAIEKRVNPATPNDSVKHVPNIPGRTHSPNAVNERLYETAQPKIPKGKDISKTDFHWDLPKGR